MKPKIKPTSGDDSAEKCLQHIQAIRSMLHIPNEHRDKLRECIMMMKYHITGIKESGFNNGADDFQRLFLHLDQMAVHCNQMECGDFMIKMDHALQAAYKNLP